MPNDEVSPHHAAAQPPQSDARLWARILSPAGAQFTVLDAQPLPTSPHPEGPAKNESIRRLAIYLRDVTDLRLPVLPTPGSRGEETTPSPLHEAAPLTQW